MTLSLRTATSLRRSKKWWVSFSFPGSMPRFASFLSLPWWNETTSPGTPWMRCWPVFPTSGLFSHTWRSVKLKSFRGQVARTVPVTKLNRSMKMIDSTTIGLQWETVTLAKTSLYFYIAIAIFGKCHIVCKNKHQFCRTWLLSLESGESSRSVVEIISGRDCCLETPTKWFWEHYGECWQWAFTCKYSWQAI